MGKNAEKIFQNDMLQEAIDHSLPWFDLWDQFKHSVIADIESFEKLLNEKNIPITAWVAVGEYGFLGWAPQAKSDVMALLFKKSEKDKPIIVKESDLETKVLIFPYISELSYLLCTRIKLAHTSQSKMQQYASGVLGQPEKQKTQKTSQPVKVAKYI